MHIFPQKIFSQIRIGAGFGHPSHFPGCLCPRQHCTETCTFTGRACPSLCIVSHTYLSSCLTVYVCARVLTLESLLAAAASSDPPAIIKVNYYRCANCPLSCPLSRRVHAGCRGVSGTLGALVTTQRLLADRVVAAVDTAAYSGLTYSAYCVHVACESRFTNFASVLMLWRRDEKTLPPIYAMV